MVCDRCGKNPRVKKRKICTACHREQVYAWRASRRESDPEGYKRMVFNNRLWSMFRIRRDRFEELLAVRGGCACCGTAVPKSDRGWHVDHDHKCCPGERSCGLCVRGVLCATCNVALGVVNDDVELLRALIEYLDG